MSGCVEIIKNLYIGNINIVDNESFIKSHKIKNILNLSNKIINIYPHIVYIHHKNTQLINYNYKYYDKYIKIIDDSLNHNKAILVVCETGMNHSAIILIAYFIKINNLSVHEAYNFINSKHTININFEYLDHLNKYASSLK